MIEPEVYHLKKYEFDFTPDIIYTDGFEYSATMAALNKFPNAISVLGAGLNYADPKEVLSIAKQVKYVIFSMEFACQITKMRVDMDNPTHLLNLFKELKVKFPNNNVIVTMQNKGAMFEINNEVKVMQTLPVKEVDRTGAGDIFDGAFIHGLGKKYDLEKCIRLANIAAAMSTTKYGAKASIPILSDVITEYESKFGAIDVSDTPIHVQNDNSDVVNNASINNNQIQAQNTVIDQNNNISNDLPKQNGNTPLN